MYSKTIDMGLEIFNIIVASNRFTPKSDQLQFSLSFSHQRYIVQCGEFGNR